MDTFSLVRVLWKAPF